MVLFKRLHTIRRYSAPTVVRGYPVIPFSDVSFMMDVQTTDNVNVTTPDGTVSRQRLKVFCDEEILVESQEKQQKADRLYFKGKWYECVSCRLSENTRLRHYLATFVECLDQPEVTEE